jgi:hypothetical protein
MTTTPPTTDDIADQILDEIEAKQREFAATIKIGDMVYAGEDKTFTFTRYRYCTAGKGYKVNHIKGDSVSCDADILGETLWLSSLGITHATREGEIVWDSRNQLAWTLRPDDEIKIGAYPPRIEGQEGQTFRGYWVNNYRPEEDGPQKGSFLVELTTPFLEGKPGDLIVVSLNQCHITEINGQDVSHEEI